MTVKMTQMRKKKKKKKTEKKQEDVLENLMLY